MDATLCNMKVMNMMVQRGTIKSDDCPKRWSLLTLAVMKWWFFKYMIWSSGHHHQKATSTRLQRKYICLDNGSIANSLLLLGGISTLDFDVRRWTLEFFVETYLIIMIEHTVHSWKDQTGPAGCTSMFHGRRRNHARIQWIAPAYCNLIVVLVILIFRGGI